MEDEIKRAVVMATLGPQREFSWREHRVCYGSNEGYDGMYMEWVCGWKAEVSPSPIHLCVLFYGSHGKLP